MSAPALLRRPFANLRTDRWWLAPLRDGAMLGIVLLYSGWAAFQESGYAVGPYISPLATPCLAAVCGEHASLVLFGEWYRLSPVLIVVAFPVGFRLTCYYYRKVYYRSYFFSPPACAVTEPRGRYRGEARFPLVLQNLHRYFWFLGMIIAVVLTIDAVRAFHFAAGWGVGVGSLVLTVNAVLWWGYALSCHSCRHIVGGQLKHFSKHPVRYRMWRVASRLNARHLLFAWTSLPMVPLTDLYVRVVASGALPDVRLL